MCLYLYDAVFQMQIVNQQTRFLFSPVHIDVSAKLNGFACPVTTFYLLCSGKTLFEPYSAWLPHSRKNIFFVIAARQSKNNSPSCAIYYTISLNQVFFENTTCSLRKEGFVPRNTHLAVLCSMLKRGIFRKLYH